MKDYQKWERGNCYDGWVLIKGKLYKNYNRKGRKDYEEGHSVSVSPPTTWVGEEETYSQSPWMDGISLVKFGNYTDWTYGEILTKNPNYASYIRQESFGSSEEQ